MKSRYVMFLGPVAAVILGVLFRLRLLPFLNGDTIVSGGKEVPTADFANFMSRIFFIFAFAALVFAIIYLMIGRRKAAREP